MLVMPVVETLKKLSRKGMSIREMSRKTGISRNTISKYLGGATPIYNRSVSPKAPKRDRITPIIIQWISEDESAPRKQKRTRLKIYKDLVSIYGYDGSYSTVKNVINEVKLMSKEVFVPRHHKPGMSGEFDFGELYVDIGSVRTRLYLHAYQLPYSNKKFGQVSIRATQEEMFDSHRRAFEYYKGVPHMMRYDNLKQAVKKVLKGSRREENDHFVQFRNQQGFEAEYCDIGKGNQKGDVEGCVGYIRRNFFSPVISINTIDEIDELNRKLAIWCNLDAMTATVPDTDSTVAELFEIEQSMLQQVRENSQDVGKYKTAKANHYSMISVDQNFYSVPVQYAYKQVDVLCSAREVIIYGKTTEIARHKRCFEKSRQIFDAVHYIEVFRKKPYALINGKPIAHLPNAFGLFFSRAYHKGTLKSCIDVMSLLKTHSIPDVKLAIELSMAYDTYSADGVKNLLNQLHSDQPKITKLSRFKRSECGEVRILPVDLNRYDRLICDEVQYV